MALRYLYILVKSWKLSWISSIITLLCMVPYCKAVVFLWTCRLACMHAWPGWMGSEVSLLWKFYLSITYWLLVPAHSILFNEWVMWFPLSICKWQGGGWCGFTRRPITQEGRPGLASLLEKHQSPCMSKVQETMQEICLLN